MMIMQASTRKWLYRTDHWKHKEADLNKTKINTFQVMKQYLSKQMCTSCWGHCGIWYCVQYCNWECSKKRLYILLALHKQEVTTSAHYHLLAQPFWIFLLVKKNINFWLRTMHFKNPNYKIIQKSRYMGCFNFFYVKRGKNALIVPQENWIMQGLKSNFM